MNRMSVTVNSRIGDHFKIGEHGVEEVEKFTYFGANVGRHDGDTADMKKRMVLVSVQCRRLTSARENSKIIVENQNLF